MASHISLDVFESGSGSGPTVTGPIASGSGPTVTGSVAAGSGPTAAGSVPTATGPIAAGSGPTATGPISAGSGPTAAGSGPTVTEPTDAGSGPTVTGPTVTGSGPTDAGSGPNATGLIAAGSGRSATAEIRKLVAAKFEEFQKLENSIRDLKKEARDLSGKYESLSTTHSLMVLAVGLAASFGKVVHNHIREGFISQEVLIIILGIHIEIVLIVSGMKFWRLYLESREMEYPYDVARENLRRFIDALGAEDLDDEGIEIKMVYVNGLTTKPCPAVGDLVSQIMLYLITFVAAFASISTIVLCSLYQWAG